MLIKYYKKHISYKDDIEHYYIAIGSYSLMVILGLTWILGFFYFADGAEALAILFTITNSLQGVAIFVFHVLLHDKARFCLIENMRNIRRSLRNLKVNRNQN